MKQRQDNLPDIPSQVHQRTWLALENMTDYAAFQQLSDEVFTAHWRYKIHPRGISARGTVKGQPDSWGHDDKGKLCAFEYGTSPDWHRKLEDDLEQVARIEGFKPEVFVFCTNRFVSADAERECAAMVQRIYGWELRLFGQGDLAVPLNTTCQYLRKNYLGIDVERHNWTSLLAACKDQRCRILKQYSEKYDPSLYVQRDAEQKIDSWYRQVKMSRRQGQHPEEGKRKTGSQLFVMVDQAGVGKTNVVLHLAEKYGKVAPIIVIPGSRTIIDEYTLEREIVHAVGYPVDSVIRARVYELCQIAQHEGSPLLVIVEGVDENRDLIGIRKAIEELLTACQDYPLLLLITCRDTIWPFIQSSTLKGFITEGGVLPLSLYTDEEFEQARKKYFTHWNVHVELSVEAKNGLRSPLLLSIFAEVNQDCSFKFVSSVAAKDLWGKYLEKKIDAIHEALEMGKSKQAIRTAIEQIALRMLERNSPSLFYSDVSDLNRHIDLDDTSTHSLFLQLKNAAVLFEETHETVSFVYETFLEYVAGQALARAFEISTERERVLERIEELTRTYRWRQIPLYCAELVSEPDAIIERLRKPNIWLAAQAFRRTTSRTSPEVRKQLIADLEEKLSSKFSLDHQRAADFLGLLGSSKSKDKLLHCWSTYTSNVHETQATLCALARLGVEDIVEPFIRHLGGFLEWYIPDDQELVDTLPERFRCQLLEKALALLQDPVQMGSLHDAAAHTIGYLKAEQAITPLLSYLKATEWCRWVAMLALIRIGTQEAFTALEIALGEIGERISTSDRQLSKAKDSMDDQKEDRQMRDELVIALSIVRTHGFYHSSLHVIVPFLVRLLEHPNMYVRHEAIQSLGELGAYETALAITKSRSPEALIPGFGIAETLTAFGSHIHIEPILALVNDPSTPEMVVRDAIKALGVSRDKRVLEPLSVFIAQGRFLLEVIQALGDTGLHEAIPLLVRVLEDDSMDDSTESSLSRANLEYFAVENLGKLQHPDAFAPIERYARKHLPTEGHMTLSALVASDGERALPFLQDVWERDPEKRKTILRALLWIGTRTATNKIIELLQPIDGEKAATLANALSDGRGLDFITGTTSSIGILEAIDSRLVAILDAHYNEMAFDGKWRAIIAMKYIGNHAARQLLERIATDPKYGEIRFPNARPGSFQTLRQAAIHILCDLGSNIVIDAVLDTLSNQPANIIEFRLQKMDYKMVRDALQRRLPSANDLVLIRLLTLLGTFGDHTVLPTFKPYIEDSREEVANAAYEAEQRILGLAYF